MGQLIALAEGQPSWSDLMALAARHHLEAQAAAGVVPGASVAQHAAFELADRAIDWLAASHPRTPTELPASSNEPAATGRGLLIIGRVVVLVVIGGWFLARLFRRRPTTKQLLLRGAH